MRDISHLFLITYATIIIIYIHIREINYEVRMIEGGMMTMMIECTIISYQTTQHNDLPI